MKRLLIALVIATGFAPTPVAQASYNLQGDGRLVVEQGPCRGWEASNGWCGPALIVRLPADVSVLDEEQWISGSLEGPNGSVALQFGTTLLASNGARLTDVDYWNYRTETVAPTNLPYGTYTYKWNYSYPGQWKCSKYFRSGCLWLEDENFTWTYRFDWQGTRIDTFPVQDQIPIITSSANNVTAASAKNLSTTRLADYMTGAGYTYKKGDKITVKVTSGRSCKIVKKTVRTIRSGTCKVRLTAVTNRGLKYVFNFSVKVK